MGRDDNNNPSWGSLMHFTTSNGSIGIWDQSFLLGEKGRNCCSPACGRDGLWYYFSDASPVTESTTSNHVLSHDAITPQKHPLALMVSLAVVHSHFTLLIQRSPGGWWASSFGYRS